MKTLSTLAVMAALSLGCGAARTPELYRDDARKLFDARRSDLKSCYDGVLKSDPKAAGKVTVTFSFKEKSGELMDAETDAAHTTAPESVRRCVLSSLRGIVLAPADKKRGEGTWTWDFSAAP